MQYFPPRLAYEVWKQIFLGNFFVKSSFLNNSEISKKVRDMIRTAWYEVFEIKFSRNFISSEDKIAIWSNKKQARRIVVLGFEQKRSMACRRCYDMCMFQGPKPFELIQSQIRNFSRSYNDFSWLFLSEKAITLTSSFVQTTDSLKGTFFPFPWETKNLGFTTGIFYFPTPVSANSYRCWLTCKVLSTWLSG